MLERAARIRRTFRHLQRFRDIVRVFLKYGYQDVAQRLHLPTLLDLPLGGQSTEIASLSAAERFRRACEELGPTFVKFGQVLSTRPDLVPAGFAGELSKLQDSASPLPFSEIRRVLDVELKGRTDELFSRMDEQPLGSASMAQAHRAKLKTGESVVVKVQRPGIRPTLSVDIEILREVADLMEEHIEGLKKHRPRRAVEELIRKLESELDFCREAANTERFAAQFEGDPWIRVPRIYREATTSKVITLEFVDGVKASLVPGDGNRGLDPVEVARRLAVLVLRQIFVHGFFHADPHPGNVMILPGNVICFVDYGQMGYLDGAEREDFADMLAGVAKRDAAHVAQALSRLGAGGGGSLPGLEADAAEFMHQHFYRPIKELEFGRLVNHLLDITSRHDLGLPPDFFSMLKAFSVTESLVRSLDPSADLIEQAVPVVSQVRLRRLSPSRLVSDFVDAGAQFGSLVRDLPSELRRLMSQAKSGEIRFVFRHDNLEPLIHSLDQTSNRLSYSVVLASLIIGSSLIVVADVPPRLGGIPVIGLLGFLLAGMMGFWLLIAIIRHGRL